MKNKTQERQRILFKEVNNICAFVWDISYEDIIGKNRQRRYCYPRHYARYIMNKKLDIPFLQIAKLFNCNHSSVINSIKQVEKWQYLVNNGIKIKEYKLINKVDNLLKEKKIF